MVSSETHEQHTNLLHVALQLAHDILSVSVAFSNFGNATMEITNSETEIGSLEWPFLATVNFQHIDIITPLIIQSIDRYLKSKFHADCGCSVANCQNVNSKQITSNPYLCRDYVLY